MESETKARAASLLKPLRPSEAQKIPPLRKPDWLRMQLPSGETYQSLKNLLREKKLHTVCEEARCPNLGECWAGGTATIMLGGDICTRGCRFCAVKTARRPPALDPDEPRNVSKSISELNLRYVVLTSVDRDDLEDQMSGHFAETIRGIKTLNNEILIEALVPDFRGDSTCVEKIVSSGVDVYAHNIETVKNLQARVRDPRAGYTQSLETLGLAKIAAEKQKRMLFTKSSIMLGLGETADELRQTFLDLRSHHVDILTLGQYLRPTLEHLPVEKFYSPQEFHEWKKAAESFGFLYVAAGPMVRSSYRAGEFFIENRIRQLQQREKG